MTKIYIRKETIFGNALDFFITKDFKDGMIHLAEPLLMKSFDLGESSYHHTPATFTLEIKDAQKLIDSLWDCGLRPSEGSGSAGAMAATQKHLEDMRTLVFKNV